MTSLQRTSLFIAVCLGTFLASLDISIVNVALPDIQHHLQGELSQLQWIVNAYAICLSAFMLSAGVLSDRFGHKRIWLIGAFLFTLGSLLCATAQTMTLLLIGRIVQGVAGAILVPGAMAMISFAYTDPKARNHAIGIWSAISALALILGPLLGGILIEHLGWHRIFTINIPVGIIAMLLGYYGMQEHSYPEHAALDPLGQLLSVTTLALLSYSLILAGEIGFLDSTTLSLLLLSGVCLLLFFLVEFRSQRPIIELRLFKNRAYASINYASFMLGFAAYSSLFFFSFYLQQIQGYSPQMTGLRMVPQFLLTGIVSLYFGHLNRYFTLRHLICAGYLIIGLSMAAMASFTPESHYVMVGGLFALLGVGMGIAVPATGLMIMNSVKEHQFAMASATMNALRQMGMAIGIALLGSLMSQQATERLLAHLQEARVTDALEQAEQAVYLHQFTDHLARAFYVTAMNSGFALVMIVAGIASLSAVGILFIALPHQTRQSSPSPLTTRKRG